jgi:glycosyltransferase involved in cell wall biosynthesis
MRFHLLGIPHTVTSKEYNACAFTQKVWKFGKMMKARGHTIIHYGHEDSDIPCDEHVTVMTNKDLEKSYGSYDWRKEFFKHHMNDYAHQTFAANAIKEIQKRKQPNDFLLPFWGGGVRRVTDYHNDMICVEPGIGYPTPPICRWKVYESYAILHATGGIENVAQCKQDFYDVVIPNYFDPDDFEYRYDKEDYFLYLGRVYTGKGVDIAIEVTQALGKKLIIAGQTDGTIKFPDNVEYVGYADVATRKKLMAGACGSFLPTRYIEPFGGVAVENLFSGTPIITTDWGAFTEYNAHGVTGFRCRTFDDFCTAAENINRIRPINCFKQAQHYSLEAIAPRYEKYFQDVLNVYTGKGWYQR